MDEYELLHKACFVLKNKLDKIRDKMKTKNANESHLSIELENEDHTMGELINTYLQDHKNVEFAGVKKPNFLIDSMVITYVASTKNPLEPFYETLDFIDEIMEVLIKKFESLGGKYITYDYKKSGKNKK